MPNFTLAQRRLAENLKAAYIRNHPTPPSLSNNAQTRFRSNRNRNARNYALRIASATPSATAAAVNRVVNRPKAVRGSKSGSIRALASKKTFGKAPKSKYM